MSLIKSCTYPELMLSSMYANAVHHEVKVFYGSDRTFYSGLGLCDPRPWIL